MTVRPAGAVAAKAIGIDLGGTHLRVARITADGHVEAAERQPTDRVGGPEAVSADMLRLAGRLRDADTAAVGIGIPGSIDADAGLVLNIPALSGWQAVPLADRIGAGLSLPCRLENDAKAAALGEWYAGAGRGCRNFVYLTISTGIGSVAVVDGRLLRGAGGLAGEIGHTKMTDSPIVCACGLKGCWQAVASGAALDARGQAIAADDPNSLIARLAGGLPVTGSHVGAAARAGDAKALALLAEHAELLGYGLANLQHVYAPDRIVVGGGVSALLDLMETAIQCTLRMRLLPGFEPASIVRSALGDDAGLVGAALAVL